MESINDLSNNYYYNIHIATEELPNLSHFQHDSNLERTDRQLTSQKILNVTSLSVANDSGRSSGSPSGFELRNINKYASTIPEIDFNALVAATGGWNEQHKLGQGGFGTVYKGKWKMTDVAIKRLKYNGKIKDSRIQWKQSMTELKYLNSARHDNILPLYGYSINGSEPCLVYQLMLGGSLEQRLSNKTIHSPLTWSQRFIVARGTARGLQFLHTFKEKPLIHGDIKPANILLDPCSHPKIGDFGLAREGPLDSTVEVSKIYGTKPYLPSEFLNGKFLSTKVDTYSYGVVLFELVTGWKVYEKTRKVLLLPAHISQLLEQHTSIIEFMDKSCAAELECEQLAEVLLNLGRMCTSDLPSNRPDMEQVLRYLESMVKA